MRKVMSYFVLLFVALSSTLSIYAQGDRVVERLYIATDKDSYIAGDRVWCSIYCFEAGQKMELSGFSSTVYLELQDQHQVVLTAKVALIEGRGAGAIELPPTLPTGNYKLLGYTSQQRNEEGFLPEEKILTIYNVLTADRVEGGVELVPEGQFEPAASQKEGAFSVDGKGVVVELPSMEVNKGEEFYLKLHNNSGERATFNLSVYRKDPFAAGRVQSIGSFMDKVTSTPCGKVTGERLPDYEGEVVRLSVGGQRDKVLNVSFPGKLVDSYASEIDEAGGAYVVTPNIYGDRDMVCEGGEEVSICDPFIRDIRGGIPPLKIYPEMEETLASRGFSMQVGRRFDADTLYERLPVRPNALLDLNKVTYILDDYTRFPKMEEVLSEFVSEIRVRTVKREKRLSILVKTYDNTYYASGYSLILLDGVPVTDQSRILEYDPLLLHRIEIYTGIYSVGNTFYEGVANFITYKGDMSGFEFGDKVKIISYKGSLYPLSFTGSSINVGGEYPDYRETIYWHPIMEMAQGEEMDVRCIAPLYSGEFDIIVEGVSYSGTPIYYKSTLKIR